MGVMEALDITGHTRHEWNPNNADEVALARDTFERLTKKGYRAFRVNADGEQGSRITAFDPNLERMLLTPAVVGG